MNGVSAHFRSAKRFLTELRQSLLLSNSTMRRAFSGGYRAARAFGILGKPYLVVTMLRRWWSELLRDMPGVGMLTTEPAAKQPL